MTKIKQKETLGVPQIIESIRKYSTEKITDRLIEQYHEAASLRGFTTDMVLLDLNKKSQYQIEDKYIFIIDGETVALSESTVDYIRTQNLKVSSINDIKTAIKESKHV